MFAGHRAENMPASGASAKQADGGRQLPTSSQPGTANARILVLLATYNGGRYLDEQLGSIFNQSIARVDVLASDDGSSDDTRPKLDVWGRRWTKGDFGVLGGPRQGFSENFRSLIVRAAPSVDTYVA